VALVERVKEGKRRETLRVPLVARDKRGEGLFPTTSLPDFLPLVDLPELVSISASAATTWMRGTTGREMDGKSETSFSLCLQLLGVDEDGISCRCGSESFLDNLDEGDRASPSSAVTDNERRMMRLPGTAPSAISGR